MGDWFNGIAAGSELPADAVHELLNSGFVVTPGSVIGSRLAEFAQAYDMAVARAAPGDMRIGSSTTRVHDFVNRGVEFDELYVYRPVLEACCRVIGKPFKLSSMLARTVRPGADAQPLHVDFRGDQDGWPMVGFIVMVDDFRADNGSTRFVPGSHKWPTLPTDVMEDPVADHENQVLACGVAASVIVYNGSAWHGHSANRTSKPRRSIQGAYVRRDTEPWSNQAAHIRQDTFGRIGSLAKYLLGV